MSASIEHVDRMTAERGWFLPQLILIEGAIWGRWPWWLACLQNGTILDWAIPQVPFAESDSSITPAAKRLSEDRAAELIKLLGSGAAAASHVRSLFERATRYSSGHLRDLIDWWLWGFGSPRIEQRPKIDDRIAVLMYTELRLDCMIAHPRDWGTVMIQAAIGETYGKGSAWFPTPMGVVECMTRMAFCDSEIDHRIRTVNEPCLGTGNFLLCASNYSLRLSGQDVDYLMCAISEFMGYLFVPWLVRSGEGIIREFGETHVERRIRSMLDLLRSSEPREQDAIETPPAEIVQASQLTLF